MPLSAAQKANLLALSVKASTDVGALVPDGAPPPPPPPPPVLAIGARVRAFAVAKPNVAVRATPVQGGTQLQPPQPQNALGVIVAPGESGGYWKVDFDTGVDGWVWAANLTAITP